MTEKSKLNFGQYQGMTVGEILKLGKFDYLRWVYYNFEGLSFTAELLDKIYIPEDWRIDKPGKNGELGQELNNRIFNHRRIAISSHVPMRSYLRKRKAILVSFMKKDRLHFNKKALQWKNQGH